MRRRNKKNRLSSNMRAEQFPRSAGIELGARFDALVHETSSTGWDGERARMIPISLWERARELAQVAAAEVPNLPAPFPSACEDGSVHLRWAAPSRSLNVELHADRILWTEKIGGMRSEGESARIDVVSRLRALFG